MFDFPTAPVDGDVYEPLPGLIYTFNGTGWSYTTAPAALTLSVLLPAYMLAGGGVDRTLRALGLGFMPTSEILLDGTPIPTIFASTEELQAEILASAETAARVVEVTVRNSAIESNALPLNFVLTPVLTATDPTQISLSGGPTPITCTGTDFVDGSNVVFNYQEMATTFVSATELTAVVVPDGSPGDSLYIWVQTGRLISSNQLLLDVVA